MIKLISPFLFLSLPLLKCLSEICVEWKQVCAALEMTDQKRRWQDDTTAVACRCLNLRPCSLIHCRCDLGQAVILCASISSLIMIT